MLKQTGGEAKPATAASRVREYASHAEWQAERDLRRRSEDGVEVARAPFGDLFLELEVAVSAASNSTSPVEGGKVTAYRIQRRRHTEEGWEEAGMSVETQALLSGQERGVGLVYHVIAVNKAGEGVPSNIVTTVL